MMKRMLAGIIILSLSLFAVSAVKISQAEATETDSNLEMEIIDGDFDEQQLIQIAIDNQKNSYAPYSDYNVSAAVLMDSGIVYTGVNVENSPIRKK